MPQPSTHRLLPPTLLQSMSLSDLAPSTQLLLRILIAILACMDWWIMIWHFTMTSIWVWSWWVSLLFQQSLFAPLAHVLVKYCSGGRTFHGWYCHKFRTLFALPLDSIKSSNIPPSTTLNSLLTIPMNFFSQQALCFAGCCQEIFYHSYLGCPKAKMLQAVKECLLRQSWIPWQDWQIQQPSA